MKIPKPFKKTEKKKEEPKEEKFEPTEEMDMTPPETQQKTVKTGEEEETIKIETTTDQLLYTIVQQQQHMLDLKVLELQHKGIIKEETKTR